MREFADKYKWKYIWSLVRIQSVRKDSSSVGRVDKFFTINLLLAFSLTGKCLWNYIAENDQVAGSNPVSPASFLLWGCSSVDRAGKD